VQFTIAVHIAAPPAVAWSVMSDVERWHEWTASIRRVTLLDSRPLRVGSRALIRQPRFPPALWTVVDLQPGRSFTWRSGFPGMWVFGTHTVEPSVDGTRATLSLRYQGLLGRLFARLTRDITNRYIGMEAAGLKTRSEERAGPPGGPGAGA
jgi:hypothetical protein